MSFVLDVCKSLLSALYTYVGRKNSEGPSLRSDFNRLVYGGKIIYNEIKYICWAVEARIHQNKDFLKFLFHFFSSPWGNMTLEAQIDAIELLKISGSK